MGKDSLIQSTTKGKKRAGKKKPAKKKAVKAKGTPKAKAAVKAKAAPKAKAKSKAKAKAAPKAAPKPKAAVKAKAVSKKKPISVKELLQKKFPVWTPDKRYVVDPDKGDTKDFTAPPFVSGPEAEQKRIKELLLKTYDMAEIKAAGEKAAAEKVAAEKAAAEKAAAEKAAAEKAAAEKAAAEPEVSVSYEPPDTDDTIPADPMDKAIKYMAAAVAALILLVIGSSMVNQGKYYIQSTDGALQIFQGRFAPMGEKLLLSLPGVQAPEKAKDIYSKTDVFPLIFNYYVEKADTLLNVPGLPDFEGIKKYIKKASPYAITPASKDIVYKRLSNIDLMILLYKADVAAGKSTLADLKEARGFLSEASRLDIDDMQLDLVHQKMDAVDEHITALKAKKTAAKTPAHAAPAPPAKAKEPAHAAPEPHPKPHGK